MPAPGPPPPADRGAAPAVPEPDADVPAPRRVGPTPDDLAQAMRMPLTRELADLFDARPIDVQEDRTAADDPENARDNS